MLDWSRRHLRTFRARLAAGVALVHAVLMALFVADLVLEQQRFLHERHAQRGLSITQSIAQHTVSDLLSADFAATQELVQGFATYPELRYLAVVDASGRVIAHTEREHVGARMTDPESTRMLRAPLAPYIVMDDGTTMDAAAPVVWQGQAIGWVRFAAGMEGVNQQLRKVILEGAAFGLLAVVIGVLLAIFTARSTTRGLYRLMQVAEATRHGERTVRAKADEHSEVGRLAGSFNAMLDALAVQERALIRANQELESGIVQRTAALAESEEALQAILEQANDAFVTVGEDGRVTRWNKAAQQIFGWTAEEALGAPLAELIMPPTMRGPHLGWMQRYLQHGGNTRMVDRRAELTGWRRDGTTFPVEVAVRVRTRSDGIRFFDAFMRDISERKVLETQLKALALEDNLTQLPNRRAVLQVLPAAHARAVRSGKCMALLYLDLDGFKGVNDQLGHLAGDEVLRIFGSRLKRCTRASDMVGRLGGDEFVVVLEGLTSVADAELVAEKCVAAGAEPYALGQAIANLSTSVGIRVVDAIEGHIDAALLLAQADEALYMAKRSGKHCWHLWQAEPHAALKTARA